MKVNFFHRSGNGKAGLKGNLWLYEIISRLKRERPIEVVTLIDPAAERKDLSIVFNPDRESVRSGSPEGTVWRYKNYIRPVWENPAPDVINVDLCAAGIPDDDKERFFFEQTVSDILHRLLIEFGGGQDFDLRVVYSVADDDPMVDKRNDQRKNTDENRKIVSDQFQNINKKCQVFFHTEKYIKETEGK